MMTRYSVFLMLFVAATVLAVSCSESNRVTRSGWPDAVEGNGNVVDQPRAVGGISRINHGGVGTLIIRQGAHEELMVRAEENLLDYLHTETQSGQLTIWKEGLTLRNNAPIEYHLTVTSLDRLELTGAGNVQGSNLDTGSLMLRLTGVGGVEIFELSATALEVETSGVGGVTLSGSVHEQEIRLGGLGSYDGRHLTSSVADVTISRGGSATVRVEDHLTATIRGSGNVYYIGDPVVVSSISGSGEVVQIGG